MRYIFIFHIIYSEIVYFLKTLKSRALNLSANRTSRIHRGVVLVDAKLEGFNVLFNDVEVISSIIGKHSYIQKNSTVVNATIGKFCSIASNVSIGPGIHKLDSISTHPSFYLYDTPLIKKYSSHDLFITSKRTILGNDVWIGEKVIILDGVSIGTGAVIAAGAVVNKDVPPYAIFGGIPARLIRYRFCEEIRSKLLDSEWWDWPESVLEKEFSSFVDVKEFEKLKIRYGKIE